MKSAPNQKAEKVSPASQLDLFAGPVSPVAIVQGKALDQVATRLAQDARPPMPRLSVASPAQPSGAQQLPEFSGDPGALRQGALLDVRQAAAWLGLSKSRSRPPEWCKLGRPSSVPAQAARDVSIGVAAGDARANRSASSSMALTPANASIDR